MHEILHNQVLWISLAYVVCIVAFSMGLSYWSYWRKSRRRRPLWRAIAAMRGGEFHVRPRWSGSFDAIEVDVDQARVYLDIEAPGHADRPDVMTRCRAGYLLSRGPRFRVYRDGIMASIGKALGGQDVVLGVHEAFDRHFVVRCEVPALVRAVLRYEAMDRLVHLFPDSVLESDGTTITLRTRQDHQNGFLLQAMLDLVGMLASADLFGLAALRSLPGATYHPPHGPWDQRSLPHVTVTHPAPVMFRLVGLQGEPATRAILTGSGAQPLGLRVRDSGSIEPADAIMHIPPDVVTMLRQLGSGTLISSGTTTSFTWNHVETDPERLRAVIALLGRLAGVSLPAPQVPEPSQPEPSLPEPSLPEPSLPEPSLSERPELPAYLERFLNRLDEGTSTEPTSSDTESHDPSNKMKMLEELFDKLAPILQPPHLQRTHLKTLGEVIDKVAPMLRELGALPADDPSRTAERLADIIAALEPIRRHLGSQLAKSYVYEDRLPLIDVHEYFDERGLVLVGYPGQERPSDRPTDFSDACLVLLTDGRLAELRRSGYESTWNTDWKAEMRFLSPQEAVAAYSPAACAEKLSAELEGLHTRRRRAIPNP